MQVRVFYDRRRGFIASAPAHAGYRIIALSLSGLRHQIERHAPPNVSTSSSSTWIERRNRSTIVAGFVIRGRRSRTCRCAASRCAASSKFRPAVGEVPCGCGSLP